MLHETSFHELFGRGFVVDVEILATLMLYISALMLLDYFFCSLQQLCI